MIAYIKGEIIKKTENALIIEKNGLGYLVFVAMSVLQNNHINNETELWLHHHIKEDISALYGFTEYASLELFQKFLNINGIGPKVALAIIGQYTPNALRDAITNDDVAAFQAVPGIGKKTAMRIIIELKNKLPAEDLADNVSSDVVDALKNLGYDNKQIKDLLVDLPEDMNSIEEQIKWALKNIHR